ncbi:MAG: hypothetical protein C5B54_10935 [Acidobacteria bacterium]|nr:MAG: hypothetical protein C5B54_10935 [Acidobacteriota bacterium]
MVERVEKWTGISQKKETNMSNEMSNPAMINALKESGAMLLFLDTKDIVESEVTNVRPWSTKNHDEEEIQKIEALAATIEEEGQIEPVVVRKGDNGSWELVAGRRRKKAVELINAGRSKEQELKLSAIVSTNAAEDQNAYRQACIENMHRENLSAMDLAMNIQNVREKFKWTGKKETKKVAEFFKVSAATVTQYEKLLGLDADMQKKVHEGDVSRDDAFRLAEVTASEGAKKAAEIEQAATLAHDEVLGAGGTKKKAKAAKTKAIKKATRKETTPRSKSEIIEFFEGMLGPAYGYPNGNVHMFVNKFIAWCKGELSDQTLEKYWDEMVQLAFKGTPEVNKKEVVTAVLGKRITRKKAANKK